LFVQKERKRRTSHRTQNINDELVQNVPSFTEPIDIKHKVLVLFFFCLEITDKLVAFRKKKVIETEAKGLDKNNTSMIKLQMHPS
jgi:hypothetical protein